MLPLDSATSKPVIPLEKLRAYFQRLSALGAKGVMLDVWWGLCEKSPNVYDFSQYTQLLQLAKDSGLSVQAVMSFHSCGGNVGDSVNIPLPEWVITASDEASAWFTDKSGYENHEYITFAADHVEFLPSKTGKRSPVTAYTEFVEAFTTAMEKAGLTDVLAELQVGLGPCGELRYPSYPMGDGQWKFPGIGEFQCYDKHSMSLLSRARTDHGVSRDVKLPPEAGDYNDNPWNARFFRSGRKTDSGKFFLNWYCDELLRHGRDVLSAVRDVTDIKLAVKVAGIHWWYHHSSRAAESTAGYKSGGGAMYPAVADLCARHEAILDFTCLEMRSIDQPLWARCGPRQLVREVFAAGADAAVGVSGENALERWDWKAFRQVIKAFRRSKARGVGYTHLRLSDDISEDGWKNFERFVREMS